MHASKFLLIFTLSDRIKFRASISLKFCIKNPKTVPDGRDFLAYFGIV